MELRWLRWGDYFAIGHDGAELPGDLTDLIFCLRSVGTAQAVLDYIAQVGSGKLYLGQASRGEVQLTHLEFVLIRPFGALLGFRDLRPNGERGQYVFPLRIDGPRNGAAILPIFDAADAAPRLGLIYEYRPPAAHAQTVPADLPEVSGLPTGPGWRLRLPGGLFDPNHDRTLVDTAIRELREEAMVVFPDDWSPERDFHDLGPHEADDNLLVQMTQLVCISNIALGDTRLEGGDEAAVHTIAVDPVRAFELVRQGIITCGYAKGALLAAVVHGILSLD